MNIIRFYTTVKNEILLRDTIIASQKAVELVLTTSGLTLDSVSISSEKFLADFARAIILEMKKKGYSDYNAIVGEDLIRVFKCRKKTMITLKWKELIIMIFQFPANPRIVGEIDVVSNKVKREDIENK